MLAALGLAAACHPACPPSAVTLASPAAEVFAVDLGAIVHRGPTSAHVVRFAGPVELVPHDYRAAGLAAPPSAAAWAQALDAPVVFNAGQFDRERRHLGWLKADGVWLGAQRKPGWMALLVSGAGPDGRARIADLQRDGAEIIANYRHVVQSMMLVDETRSVRVRQSGRSACRSVVAEDRAGRLMVITTDGAVTLSDLAAWLAASSLDVHRAMNLDGGVESQLAVRTPQLRADYVGRYGGDRRGWSLTATGLPVVIVARAPPRPGER